MPNFLHEQEIRDRYSIIAGIDEAGRGPLAGPVHAAALIFPKNYTPSWLTLLNDSKKLSEPKREELYHFITKDQKLTWSVATASAQEIDKINILQATHLAMQRAVEGLEIKPDFCLIDGRPVKNFPYPSDGLIKGDSKSYSIAAASILAKVTRDHLMMELAEKYPHYEFHRHKGYGTKVHLEALQKYGPCPEHRLTFRPVQSALTAQTQKS